MHSSLSVLSQVCCANSAKAETARSVLCKFKYGFKLKIIIYRDLLKIYLHNPNYQLLNCILIRTECVDFQHLKIIIKT